MPFCIILKIIFNNIALIAIINSNPAIIKTIYSYFSFLNPDDLFAKIIMIIVVGGLMQIFLYFLNIDMFVGLIISYFIGAFKAYPFLTYSSILIVSLVIRKLTNDNDLYKRAFHEQLNINNYNNYVYQNQQAHYAQMAAQGNRKY